MFGRHRLPLGFDWITRKWDWASCISFASLNPYTRARDKNVIYFGFGCCFFSLIESEKWVAAAAAQKKKKSWKKFHFEFTVRWRSNGCSTWRKKKYAKNSVLIAHSTRNWAMIHKNPCTAHVCVGIISLPPGPGRSQRTQTIRGCGNFRFN